MSGIDGFTKLMLHMNGVDASTTFTDDSNSPHSPVANGNAQIDTAQSVFGGASGLFDGSGDYVSVPDSDDWYFDGDFAIDFRIRWNGVLATGIMGHSNGGGGVPKWALYWNIGSLGMGNAIGIHLSTGSDVVFDTWIPTTLTWYHVAITRDGNNFRLFVDGTQIGATKVSSITFPDNVTTGLRIGTDGEGWQQFNGWIDELRISKGDSRWTSNFTPPSSEYVVITLVEPSVLSISSEILSKALRNRGYIVLS